MIKVCEICNKVKETNSNHLHWINSIGELKQEWEICEDCLTAFSVMDEYFQGQN